MKLIPLFFIFILFSCGNSLPQGGAEDYPGGFKSWGQVPVKFHVNKDYYEKYKSHFDEAQSTFLSKSGKQIIEFVISNENPKNFEDLGIRQTKYGENWIVGKEENNEFSEYDGARGETSVRFIESNIIMSRILFDHTRLNGSHKQYRAFFLHEMMHGMGFIGHFPEGASILSYDWLYADTQEITAVDRELLAKNYSFSEAESSIKDIEKLGSISEEELKEEITNKLAFEYGLSIERSREISSTLYYMKKIKNKRSLTEKELEKYFTKIIGVGHKESKKYLEEYIQGDQENFNKLLEKAADLNETSPEAIKEIFQNYIL
jgi:hypothetical protein